MLLLNPLFPVLEGNGTGTINLKLIVNLMFSALEEDGTGDTGGGDQRQQSNRRSLASG